MLLLLSNSIDETADVLMQLCRERAAPAFRFNIDLWADYRFAWQHDGFVIHDPKGRTASSGDVSACLWRRPSLLDTPLWKGGTIDDRDATAAELHTIVRELAAWAAATGRLRLIEPGGARRAGRLTQMRLARRFFHVPEWTVGWGFRSPPGRRMVKRLSTEGLGSAKDRYIFVRSVDAERLSPSWPWLLQDVATGTHDATVLHVNGRSFAFLLENSRDELNVEDWRTRIGAYRDRWIPWSLAPDLSRSIDAYMKCLGLRFGRLDFLVGKDEVSFLEVNPSGQFGWLDSAPDWSLHNAVLSAALDPSSSINGNEEITETEGATASNSEVASTSFRLESAESCSSWIGSTEPQRSSGAPNENPLYS